MMNSDRCVEYSLLDEHGGGKIVVMSTPKHKGSQEVDPLKEHRRWALATGIPFENDINRVFSKIKHRGSTSALERAFRFAVKTADDESKVRSVDFKYSVYYKRSALPLGSPRDEVKLTFIVDAKYSDTHKWWFYPAESNLADRPVFPRLIPEVRLRSPLNSVNPEFLKVGILNPDWKTAVGGRKVKIEKSPDAADREDVASVQLQVLQGVMSSVADSAEPVAVRLQSGNTFEFDEDDDPDFKYKAEFFFPIIVTNADLYLLKQDIGVAEVTNAKSEDDLYSAEPVIAVKSPDLIDLIVNLQEVEQHVEAEFDANNNVGWLKPEFHALHTLFVSDNNLQSAIESIISDFERKIRWGK